MTLTEPSQKPLLVAAKLRKSIQAHECRASEAYLSRFCRWWFGSHDRWESHKSADIALIYCIRSDQAKAQRLSLVRFSLRSFQQGSGKAFVGSWLRGIYPGLSEVEMPNGKSLLSLLTKCISRKHCGSLASNVNAGNKLNRCGQVLMLTEHHDSLHRGNCCQEEITSEVKLLKQRRCEMELQIHQVDRFKFAKPHAVVAIQGRFMSCVKEKARHSVADMWQCCMEAVGRWQGNFFFLRTIYPASPTAEYVDMMGGWSGLELVDAGSSPKLCLACYLWNSLYEQHLSAFCSCPMSSWCCSKLRATNKCNGAILAVCDNHTCCQSLLGPNIPPRYRTFSLNASAHSNSSSLRTPGSSLALAVLVAWEESFLQVIG